MIFCVYALRVLLRWFEHHQISQIINTPEMQGLCYHSFLCDELVLFFHVQYQCLVVVHFVLGAGGSLTSPFQTSMSKSSPMTRKAATASSGIIDGGIKM